MNGRKARQLRSTGSQKRLRRFRKDVREAEQKLRDERAEVEAYEAEMLAALAEEPQFAIINPFTGTVAMMAAQSMIWPLGVNGRGEPLEPQPEAVGAEGAEAGVASGEVQDAHPAAAEPEGGSPTIILPGTAEALGIERP